MPGGTTAGAALRRGTGGALVVVLAALMLGSSPAKATAATAPIRTSPSSYQPSRLGTDAVRRLVLNPTAAPAGVAQSQLRTASSPAGSSCYYSDWGDPQGDAAQLDPAAYAAVYDCPSAQWTFPVITYDSWPSTELDTVYAAIDTDGNPNTGCGGFEWIVAATYVTATAQLAASTFSTPTCTPSTWTTAGPAQVARLDTSSIALHVSNATLNVGSSLRWYAFIKGRSETTGDFLPDGSYHLEEGFAGGTCQHSTAWRRRNRYERRLVLDVPRLQQAAGAPCSVLNRPVTGMVRLATAT